MGSQKTTPGPTYILCNYMDPWGLIQGIPESLSDPVAYCDFSGVIGSVVKGLRFRVEGFRFKSLHDL